MTGGNQGIGLALCKFLVLEDGCFVYMGSRSVERGQAAVTEILKQSPQCKDMIRAIQIDVDSKTSVEAAAKTIANDLG